MYIYNTQTGQLNIRGRLAKKFNMIDPRTRIFDFWLPVKNLYFGIAGRLYWSGHLSVDTKEGEQLPKYWFKYIRFRRGDSPCRYPLVSDGQPLFSATHRLQSVHYLPASPSPTPLCSSSQCDGCQAYKRLKQTLSLFVSSHPVFE